MNFLQQLSGLLGGQNQQSGLLSWFSALSRAWSPQTPGSSPVPAPNSSTPADKTPAATPAPSTSETGEALKTLLDLLAKPQ